jgi:hypothetical protein
MHNSITGIDFSFQLSSLVFWRDIPWSLLKLTQINLPMGIQLPGIDFYQQPSTLYPSFFGGHSMELNKINSDQSSVNIQLPSDLLTHYPSPDTFWETCR